MKHKTRPLFDEPAKSISGKFQHEIDFSCEETNALRHRRDEIIAWCLQEFSGTPQPDLWDGNGSYGTFAVGFYMSVNFWTAYFKNENDAFKFMMFWGGS